MSKKLTIAELLALKGKRQIVLTTAFNGWTAQAAEEAGCIAVEMELVPAEVAAEITKRTKMLVFSMGSGPHCDGQFIFDCDILGTNSGHVPRHAPVYASLMKDAVKAFSRYREDIVSGTYPTPAHSVKIKPDELDGFRAATQDAGERT